MSTRTRRFAKQGKNAMRKAYKKVETEVMAAEGRRSVRAKARSAGKVGKKAAKVGLLVGTLAALEVVLHEIGKRRLSA
jgi:hypothetical protein